MKFLHITDIHLDHLEASTRPAYIQHPGKLNLANPLVDFAYYYNNRIKEEGIDAILLTGDISTSQYLESHLLFLESNIEAPIYFVLGNHDFYFDDKIFDGKSMTLAKKISKNGNGILKYCTDSFDIICDSYKNEIKKIGIVGVDGWYDGLYSSMLKSDLLMTDFNCIKEFDAIFKGEAYEALNDKLFYPRYPSNICMSYHFEFEHIPPKLVKRFQEISKQFADILHKQIEEVIEKKVNEIVVLTHAAPYKENSIYKGKISDSDWLPFFSSKLIGDKILEFANKYQNINFNVCCGHSHGEIENKILPNLICYTTAAEYRCIYKGRIVEI